MKNVATKSQAVLHLIYIGATVLAVGLCGTAIHPCLGLPAAIGLFTAWFVRRRRGFLRDWAPNINGENAYAILGVSQDADVPSIHRAFRRLVQKYHPDSVPVAERENATATFIRLSQAYELLTDEEKRFQYDGLIEDFDGKVPLFDEAYELLKDEDKHPIYEVYDALYNPRRLLPDFDSEDLDDNDAEGSSWTDDEAPIATGAARNQLPGRQQPAAVPEWQTQPPATERPVDPMDVDIPDAVREALGMPPRRQPCEPVDKSEAPSGDRAQTPCLRCGLLCPAPPEGGNAVCAKCSGLQSRS